jgi:hypothetical protein
VRRRDDAVVQSGAALFPQLVWAHHQWERKLHTQDMPDEGLERAYRDVLAEFQRDQGPLEQVYWCTRTASAVGMTVMVGSPPRADPLHLRERDDIVRLHRVTDWITRDAPGVAELLHECDLLAIRVGQVLRGASEQIAMRWILGIEMHLLGYFEREDVPPDERTEAEIVRTQRRKLADVEAYYHRAATQAGRVVYVSGMLIGELLVALLGVLAGFLLWVADTPFQARELALLCYGAGAVGALVSVMSRMGKPEAGRFNMDFELGRRLIRRIGAFRPFVGATFGLALYFLLESGLLDLKPDPAQKPFFYGFAAFLAGFSERFATVMFGSAERRILPSEEPQGEQAHAKAPPTRDPRDESPI